MANRRALVSAELGEPVPDTLWEYLEADGLIEDMDLGLKSAGQVAGIVRKIRAAIADPSGLAVVREPGLPQASEAARARVDALYPQVNVDPDPIYIRDGSVFTAAGVTSALDLTLAFIEDDHGPALARAVARGLVTYLHRPGNQAQMSMFMTTPAPLNQVVRRAADHIAGHLNGDLSAAALAADAGVSERHLTRLFIEHLGQPPGRFVRNARTEAAAHLLASTSLPLPGVAARCGFGSAETLRQAFVSRYGIPPSRYRATQSSASHLNGSTARALSMPRPARQRTGT